MAIEVEGPDGQVFEFPDDTPKEVMRDTLARRYMTFDRPESEIRADIGRMQGKQRELALRDWADSVVKKERANGGVGQSIDSTVRTLARGSFAGPWLDEANALLASGAHTVTGGRVGAPYDEAVAYQRAQDRAVDQESPYLSAAGQLAGGLAGGGAALKAGSGAANAMARVAAGGPLAAWRPAQTITGRTAQGAVTGALYGVNAGAGTADNDRIDGAVTGGIAGTIIGSAAPHVIRGIGSGVAMASDAMSPQLARAKANLDKFGERFLIRASGGGGAPSASSPGADAAAEQIIANQAARANLTPQMLRQRFVDADEAARFGGSSSTQNVLAPVDIDPSMQRLAGAVARQQPEADSIGRAFQFARQTGQPSGLPLPATAGIPTRAAMARPRPDDVPTGQFERVSDGLKRALQIKDAAAHGHGVSAYQTDNMITNQARTGAKKLYGDAYKAADGIDIKPYIEPVIAKWTAEAADQPEAVARAIKQMLRQFNTQNGTVDSLRRFQKSKEFADGLIEKWFTGAEGRNKYVGGLLSEIQRDMLAAVDNIPVAGTLYKGARDTFSNQMTMRDALKLGRDVFRENSEVVVDQYRQLATEGERKLFRLGLYDSFVQQMGRRGRTSDITKTFESPRIQEILQEVIPRSKAAGAEFADRPERFGSFLSNERRMIGTRDQTLGNSKTAERLGDDRTLNGMQSMIEEARRAATNPSASGIVIRAIEAAASKMFGFRADTAAAIARKLYAASPAERDNFLRAIETRMGAGRAAQFARIMAEHVQAFQQAGSAGIGTATSGQ